MSKKHNVKHRRAPSRYKERLAARGLTRTPQMTEYPDISRQAGKKPKVRSQTEPKD